MNPNPMFHVGDRVCLAPRKSEWPGFAAIQGRVGVVRKIGRQRGIAGYVCAVRWDGRYTNEPVHESRMQLLSEATK